MSKLCKPVRSLLHPCNTECKFEVEMILVSDCEEDVNSDCAQRGDLLDVKYFTNSDGTKTARNIYADGNCGTYYLDSDICCDPCSYNVTFELVNCDTNSDEPVVQPPSNLPVPRSFECSDFTIRHSAGRDGIQVDTITGLSAGDFRFKANSYSVPDRFMFYEMINGVRTLIHDTGYISSCFPTSCGVYNRQLGDVNMFTEEFNYQYKEMYGSLPPAQGLVQASNVTSWQTITKQSNETDSIIVEIWGPLLDTIFDYQVGCNI